jgi:ParB family transcriptional regulator, chromosome partitioning protein
MEEMAMPKPISRPKADILLSRLRPLNERKVSRRSFQRLVASIRAVGLIQPLCVYKEGEDYVILDGYLRYLALKELGIQVAPCLIYKTKEAYSFDKMVNPLSPIQENRMIRKALEVMDEKTIAKALGMASLRDRRNRTLLSRLAPELAKEFDAGRITASCGQHLTFVKPERQVEILKEMVKAGDFTPAFARAMVVHTPVRLRERLGPKRKSPWSHEATKQQLVDRFVEVQQRFDFFSRLYHHYVMDLLKLCIYARKLLINEKVRAVLDAKQPDVVKLFNSIIFEVGESRMNAAMAEMECGKQ